MIEKFLNWFYNLPYGEVVKEPVKPIIIPKKQSELLLEEALSVEGLDPTPKDIIRDEVACSEVISTLIQKIFPDFPILPSTRDLEIKLSSDKRFERILIPEAGCIIVSPRTDTTYGHVGLFVNETDVMSNDSFTGKFVKNYTWNSWIKEFKFKRKLSIYLYRVV